MSYYDILKVSPFSSNDDIEKAYNKSISEIENTKLLEEIHKAYITLSNYHSRSIYDKQILIQNKVAPSENISNLSSVPEVVNEELSENDNKIEKYLLDIIKRIEQLEKKIGKNSTNFYKEHKIINNTFKKNGQKIETVKNIVNDNGIIEITSKLSIYNSNGEIVNIYRDKQIKNNLYNS